MNRRLVIPSVILLLSFAVRVWTAVAPVAPVRQPLAEFPRQLGNWQMLENETIDEDTLSILKADDTMQRVYRNSDGQYASVFVAYYRAQQAGENMHSPKNCLPGSGWSPVANDYVELNTGPEGRPVRVNRYIVEKSGERDLVLYWYQEQGRVIASEYWGKLYMIWDTIRSGRRDGAIVRIIVPMRDKNDNRALETALDLVRASTPVLPRFLPN